MKTKRIKITSILFGLTLLTTPAWASDYSNYTTEELHGMRGTMQERTEQERNAFRHEWQKRIGEMPVEERGRYLGKPEDAPRDGSGQGKEKNRSRGENKASGNAYGHGKSQDGSGSYGSEMGSEMGGGQGGGMGRGGGGGRGR